jgi:hypothetical protein
MIFLVLFFLAGAPKSILASWSENYETNVFYVKKSQELVRSLAGFVSSKY